ncbi:MAG: PLP-dependent aminotransferase family protein [Parvibaculum sp.]|nr:PLP-dependent aminotransferase family protein [Parvibaculum sp.]
MLRSPLPLGTLDLDPDAEAPLYRQLYDSLRSAILDGRLAAGARLPSSRLLASDLSVGRNTVLAAFEQLTAEGYLEAVVGAGTCVAKSLPDDLLEIAKDKVSARAKPVVAGTTISARGLALASVKRVAVPYERGHGRAFQHGLPAIDLFPMTLWSRLLARRARDHAGSLFGYETGAGFRPLQEAIAAHAGAARGVVCTPDQVIVTTGAQAALTLAAQMVTDPGDEVWIEDPGYLGARGAFLGAGAKLVPVPVDAEGIDVDEGRKRAAKPKLIYVTPSHQYPLGVTLSLQRRLALLDFARSANSWILEDDYDSEYRYTGRPLASLQGLDRSGHVLYMGTFAKTLFPALRIGYLIVPDGLIEAFRTAIRLTGHIPPASMQAALADFMTEGHYGTHVRRMRGVYATRRDTLIAAIETELGEWLEASPGDGGMQMAAYLHPDADDKHAVSIAARADIHLSALSTYSLAPKPPKGLYLGFSAIPEAQIKRAAKRLADAFQSAKLPSRR